MSVLHDERDYLLSITGGEVSQDHISGNSAKRECKQELSYWISHILVRSLGCSPAGGGNKSLSVFETRSGGLLPPS